MSSEASTGNGKCASSNVCCGGACMTRNSNSLIQWKDPKKSLIAFGSIISTLLLFKFVNVVSLIFYIGTLVFSIGSILEYGSKLVLGKSIIANYIEPHTKKVNVGDFVVEYAPHFATVFKKLETKLLDLVLIKNAENSFKAAIVSYVIYLITKWVSLWNLLFVGTLLAFSLPPLYTANKKVIDANVEQYSSLAKSKVDEGIKVAETKFGPQLQKAKDLSSPLFKLVESKLPVRTAGSTVENGTSTNTGASTHLESDLKKVNKPANNENEVDFNALGEQLKNDAINATTDAEAYSKNKVDTTEI